MKRRDESLPDWGDPLPGIDRGFLLFIVGWSLFMLLAGLIGVAR